MSVKQIEDAARQYVFIVAVLNDKTRKRKDHVRHEIYQLVPLKKVMVDSNSASCALVSRNSSTTIALTLCLTTTSKVLCWVVW